MDFVCGIDEAGRGPVLGPLVMAGVCFAQKDIDTLRTLGVKDSKLLSLEKREALYEEIIARAKGYEIIVVPPKRIDSYVLSPDASKNLNWLEAETAAAVINALTPTKAILDCPSPNIAAYTAFVENHVSDKNVEIICEHKADMNYVIVGAASILAKVTRDREIEKLKQESGVDFGSGYMSDPKTQAFLDSHWDKVAFFRECWSSWQKKKEEKAQKKLGDW